MFSTDTYTSIPLIKPEMDRGWVRPSVGLGCVVLMSLGQKAISPVMSFGLGLCMIVAWATLAGDGRGAADLSRLRFGYM